MSGLLALALLAPAQAADLHPAGAEIDPALAVQLGRDGLAEVGALLPGLIPTDTQPVGDTGGEGGFGCLNYVYGLSGAWVGLQADRVTLVPRDGVLDVVADLTVWINDATDPFDLYVELFCGGQDCPGYVDPFPVTVTLPVVLTVVDGSDGHPVLDATVGEPILDNGLDGSHVQLDCALDTLETVLDFFGLSLYDLIIGVAEDQLLAQLDDVRAQLETTLEEALAAAWLDQEVDLGGAVLRLQVWPSDVSISPEGLVLVAAGSAFAEVNDCVAEHDPGGSRATDTALPALAELTPGTHAGIVVSNDLVDQVLYGVWRGGMLCYDLGDGGVDLGLPLDATLLGALGGESFGALFMEGSPLDVRTDPRAAPTVSFTGDHDLTVEVRDLGLDFFAEVDYRMARAVGMTLEADVGADVAFDGTTGELTVEVVIADDALTARATANELLPEATPALEASITALMGSLLEPLLGPALQDLGAFALPSADGFGLSSMDVGPSADGDWAVAEAALGPVPYGAGGCDSGGGCSGGCSTAGSSGVTPMLALLGLGLLRRRRSR